MPDPVKLPFLILFPLLSICIAARPVRASAFLSVPAYTAYGQPDPNGIQISQSVVTGWSSRRESVVWYGVLRQPGLLRIGVSLQLPPGQKVRLQMQCAGRKKAVSVEGSRKMATANFGAFRIHRPGTVRFELSGLARSGATYGSPAALLLSGSAVREAHFHKSPNGACPSVHLWYSYPPHSRIAAFYNEVTVRRTPLWSYYMACGFSRGYFGIQVNSPTERRIIFSVWDSGQEHMQRDKVDVNNQVTLVAHGKGVYVGGFGNEGTGLHSHLVYHWHKNETYRFLVTAKPEGTATVYSGYFYFPEKKAWGLIASFRAPHDGGWLNGLYSFNEDFAGVNGYETRLAEFGPQWIMDQGSSWQELTTAHFTFTDNGRKDRLDRGCGVVGDRFYLVNGGFVPETCTYMQELQRKPSGAAPEVDLDALPH